MIQCCSAREGVATSGGGACLSSDSLAESLWCFAPFLLVRKVELVHQLLAGKEDVWSVVEMGSRVEGGCSPRSENRHLSSKRTIDWSAGHHGSPVGEINVSSKEVLFS